MYEQEVILGMSASGMKSANYPDIGMVTVKSSYHYEVADTAKLAKAMLESMVFAVRDHRDLQDAILLQNRVSRDALEAYIGSDATEEQLANIGVRRAEKSNLSITKR